MNSRPAPLDAGPVRALFLEPAADITSDVLDRLVDPLVGCFFFAEGVAARILKGWFTVSDLIIRGPK